MGLELQGELEARDTTVGCIGLLVIPGIVEKEHVEQEEKQFKLRLKKVPIPAIEEPTEGSKGRSGRGRKSQEGKS